MKLTLDPNSVRMAYEASLKDIEAELVRQSVAVGVDLDKIDPYTYQPDYKSELYTIHKPAYDLLMATLNRYRLVDTKLKELS